MASLELFEKLSAETMRLWDQILISQVDCAFELELPFYYRSQFWHRARRVVDLGTGNGYYLRRLADRFPNKQYLGVDILTDAIQLARTRYSSDNVSFQQMDLLDVIGEYDFILIRAVVQHVGDLPQVASQICRLLGSAGCAFVIDSDDDTPDYFWPPVPNVSATFEALVKAQMAVQRTSEGMLNQFVNIVNATESLRVCGDCIAVVPSTIQGNQSRFRTHFRMILDFLDKKLNLSVDLNAARRDWEQWCQRPDSYGELSLRTIEISRRPND